MAEERISELEGVKIENSKTEKQNEKILGKKPKREYLRTVNTHKMCNMHSGNIRRIRKKRTKEMFETMSKFSPN